MIMGNIPYALAENTGPGNPGDIIHTGLKKIYTVEDSQELSDDILRHVDDSHFVEKFYRKTENGKYINLVEEENKQLEAIKNFLVENGITDPYEIQRYLIENEYEIRQLLNNVLIDSLTFDEIPGDKGQPSDYRYVSSPLILDENNYSTPEPGSKEGTTKISRLKLPTGAGKWLIRVFDDENEAISDFQKDTVIENATPYYSGRDIDLLPGNVLALYAVDNGNRLKAFVNIKIVENMINTPKELAPKIEVGNIKKGEKYAGAVIIEGLEDKLPEDATKWQVLVSNTKIDTVYKGQIWDKAFDYSIGSEIIVADESELHNIDENFKKYILLIATDNDGKTLGYNIFEIGKDYISTPPTLLQETTHYIGPVPGEEDGTTKFEGLYFGTYRDENMEEATSWKVLVSNEIIHVPKLNLNIGDLGDNIINPQGEKIYANMGDYLLLAATDNEGKIKGYKIFKLTENMVKGKTAPILPEDNYSIPTKGTVQGTTKIDSLNLAGINGATKWMYKVGTNLNNPIFNKVVEESKDYNAGQNIKANVGDYLLLLATDAEGKVKAFAKIGLTENMVKDPPAILLQETTHYIGPIKGSKKGTTKFTALSGSASIGENPVWMYKIYDEEPEIPEFNMEATGTIFKAGDNIGENLVPGKYLLLLATHDNKIKGYAIFKLMEPHIRMPDAIQLIEGIHFSTPEKGTSPGTTSIAELTYLSIEDVEQWRIKISNKKHLIEGEAIELNSIISQTTVYREGENIRAEVGDWLLLLATDRIGRIKAYAEIQLNESNLRKPNAPLLILNTNYIEPKPGSVENSTKFEFLDFSTNIVGATKWMYKIGDRTFGNIELDSVIENALEYSNINDNIVGVSVDDYLLLLATDNEGKVKGYREFKLTERNIRGGPARILDKNNYALEKGTRPGTTRFNKLLPMGMEGTIRWRYKLLENELPEGEKPYLNSIIEGAIPINVGQDIEVNQMNNGYGYILLLAVDSSGRTKGYAEIKITPDIVKEHAPILNVELIEGDNVDTVKVKLANSNDVPEGTSKYKIMLTTAPYPTPAKDDILNGGVDYIMEEDIKVSLNQYLTIFALDEENKIKAFKTFKISEHEEKIKRGKAEIVSPEIILEGSINIGGEKIKIKLSNGAYWADDIKTNNTKRNALYNGFKAEKEEAEWNKVIDALIADGSGAIDVDEDNTTLIISLPEAKGYDINEEQTITLTIPAEAIKDAINPIKASGNIVIKPTVKATISGDVVKSTVREKDIKAGGKTIVIELEDGDWVVDIDSDALISGFKVVGVDEGEDTNWNKIAEKITSSHIVRNSSKKLTITLPKVENVDFGVNKETISLTIPKNLVQGAEENIVATPTFTLYPNILQVVGEAIENTVYLEAPDGKVPRTIKDTWKIKVTTGTLKEDITNNDIVVAGLPRGLKANVENVDVNENTITIKVSGTAATKIEEATVSIRIKGTAVEELNSIDSEDIKVFLKLSEPKVLDNVEYRLQKDGEILNIYLTNVDEEMEYSVDSTNGINGTWEEITLAAEDTSLLIGEAKPMKIWVREKAQPRVVRLVGELTQEEAPKNITISNYDYENFIIALDGIDSHINYEYSTDGGNTWHKYESDTRIELSENLDLRIRKAAILGDMGKLPSKSTGKLNGIYLGNVNLNVAEGKIENTTTGMEYSTDGGNKFTQTKNKNTSIKFAKDDEVWIRERGNTVNKRFLGSVGQESFSEYELNNIDYHIGERIIKLINSPDFGLDDLQYKIANDSWKDVGDGKNIEFKAGELRFRKKGTAFTLPSSDRIKATIEPPAPAPELSYDDVNYTIEKIGTTEGAIYEYKINDGEWKSGEVSTQFEAGDEVKVRIKATKEKLPSQIQTIKFTPILSFANVYIDAGKSMIMNTTSDMEYSINSTNGLDGVWYKCNSPNTKVPLKAGMDVYIREAKKPGNFKKLTDSPMAERTLVLTIVKENIGYSVKDRTIWIKAENDLSTLQEIVENLQYRNGDSNWINIDYTKLEADKINILAYNIDFKPGKLEFRLKGDKDYLPSQPVKKAIIKAKASPPNVIINNGENIVESINGIGNWDKFEYNIDNGPWISGRYLKTEDLTSNKLLRIRFKATDNELESQETVIQIKDKFPLEHIRLSDYVHPMKLNGTTTNMEYAVRYKKNGTDEMWYRITLPDGSRTMWMNASDGNTKLPDVVTKENLVKIIIRDKDQPENQYTIYP